MTITATLAGGRPGSMRVRASVHQPHELPDGRRTRRRTSRAPKAASSSGRPSRRPARAGGTTSRQPRSRTVSAWTVEFDPNGTSPARLGDGMLPSVGDVINFECGVNEFGDSQVAGGSVPVADLLSGHPVTFTFSGSGTTPSSSLHSSVSINWSLSESVTVQRVQADGTPFTAATTDTRSSRP